MPGLDNINLVEGSALGGAALTVFKIRDDAGDYQTLFGAASGTFTDSIHLHDFVVDQNPDGNTTCNITPGNNEGTPRRRAGPNLSNRLDIERMRFAPCVGSTPSSSRAGQTPPPFHPALLLIYSSQGPARQSPQQQRNLPRKQA